MMGRVYVLSWNPVEIQMFLRAQGKVGKESIYL